MKTLFDLENTPAGQPASPRLRWPLALPAALSLGLFTLPALAAAPTGNPTPALPGAARWQACAALPDDTQRLACYDRWASGQRPESAPTAPVAATTAPQDAPLHADSADSAENTPITTHTTAAGADTNAPSPAQLIIASNDGCRNPAFDRTSRFWELNSDTDCGNFRFRGYRPLTIGAAWSNRINRQPLSPSHGLAEWRDYQRHELRLQLSVRTKLASGLLTFGHPSKRDSLWFGYTLGASWQAFNGDLSRPFRNTDHEPELIYVYPLEWSLPGGVRLRYAGLGINHQSNGQSIPLSRSWNRYYAMLGADLTPHWTVQARFWKRQREKNIKDDNPEISDTIGRAELISLWELSSRNSLQLTLRHAMRDKARGSARLEWSHALGQGFAGGKSNLRLVTGLFHGYGDSLIDYNSRRTVFSVGLSLLDF
ncbi:phospholipase [Comamonadaceae bacterium OH3737_COT-264]|nr:phospholipase [Comamonadaceae bacterium OH3737_COT-264]